MNEPKAGVLSSCNVAGDVVANHEHFCNPYWVIFSIVVSHTLMIPFSVMSVPNSELSAATAEWKKAASGLPTTTA